MRYFTSHNALSVLLGAFSAIATTASVSGSAYKITELGIRASKLNEQGQVIGIADMPNGLGSRGFVYDSNPGGKVSVVWNAPGSDRPLTDPGAVNRFTSLNDRGMALGFDNDGRNYLLDTATGIATSVAMPVRYDWARNIVGTLGNQGQIYGNRPFSDDPGSPDALRQQPYIYEGGVLRDLGTPPGTTTARSVAADHSGRLLVRAGMSEYQSAETYIYDKGTWTHVGSFAPMGFNDRGDIIGHTTPDGGQPRVLLALASGGAPIDMGTTTDGTLGEPWGAFSINSKGEVVGAAFAKDSYRDFHAFLYKDGVTTDLNTLLGDAANGWTLISADSINDRGQILVSATNSDPNKAAGYLLLTPDELPTPPELVIPAPPVPEPSTLIVFGGLALGLAWTHRRSRA